MKHVDVFLIAPADASVQVTFGGDTRIHRFPSIAAFELWRVEAIEESIRGPLEAALFDVAVDIEELPDQLQGILTWLSNCQSVPDLKQLIERTGSKSTLYRFWNAAFRESPRVFLNRVRICHARALLGTGRAEDEAARLAGFRSPTACVAA